LSIIKLLIVLQGREALSIDDRLTAIYWVPVARQRNWIVFACSWIVHPEWRRRAIRRTGKRLPKRGLHYFNGNRGK
ncbi:MAG TPA: hypothetical protein VIE65_19490, partial [Methylobacter sp.]